MVTNDEGRGPTHREETSFDLRRLLAELRGEEESRRGRTGKSERALRDGKLSGRLNWLLERRATAEGTLLPNRLQDAFVAKQERFKESEFINTAPVGPGCNWLSVGPRNINGRVKTLAIDPSNASTLYAGAANGGVWKSTDAGQSWTPKMHDQASLAIGAIAIDSNDTDVVYAGTGEAVYLLSAGAPLPPGASTLAWYYEGVGVYRSTDGGDTWTLTGSLENTFIYRIDVDPFDSNHLLCAGYGSLGSSTGGLCESTDGGATWATVITGIVSDVRFDPNNSGVAYCAQYNAGVLKTIDGGATWNARNTGLPALASIGRVNLTIAASNSDVLYAKIENDATGGFLGLFRTSTAAEDPGGWTAMGDPGVDNGFLWWCSYVEADPGDPTGSIVWAGGIDVARSDDGGTTWTLVADAYGGTKPPTHPDQHALVFDPSSSSTVYIANDGGVFKGDFVGGASPVTWSKVSTGLTVTQFYDLDSSSASRSMFGGGAQDNGSMISTGGLSWRHVFGGDGGYVAFHPTDPYTVYVQFQNANIRRSTDGANNFGSADSGIVGSGTFPATVFEMDPGNPLIMFSGTDRVHRTTNGGVGGGAWTDVSGAIGKVTDLEIAPSSSAVIYAGTVDGELHQSTDGGATFNDITPAVAGFPARRLAGIAVHPTDSNAVYMSFLGFNGSVGSTSDHVWKGVFSAGAWTWTLIATGLADVPVGAIVVDPATMDLYIATDIGVFRSTDDGVSWAPFEAGLPNVPIIDLKLDSVRGIMRAATHGRGCYQITIGGVPCPQFDLFVRDNIIDTGEVLPSPTGVPDPTRVGVNVRHYKSADLKVDAPPFDALDALTDGVEFDDPEHPYTGFGVKIEDMDGIEHDQPVRTTTNRVYAQVHNRGWDTVANATVKVLYADAGAGLPALPADFWVNFPGNGFDQTNWKPIGTSAVTDLLPAVPQVLQFDWVPPSGSSDHVCLLMMVDSPQDPLLPQTELNVDNLTRGNKKITHRNVHPVDPAPSPFGPSAWVSLYFNNGYREARFFDLMVEGLTASDARLQWILPRSILERSRERKVFGLRETPLRKEELERIVETSRASGTMTDYVARLLLDIADPVALEVEPNVVAAGIGDVLIEPGDRAPGVFTLTIHTETTRVTEHFEVNQYHNGLIIGGSEFVISALAEPEPLDFARLRVVLERIEILDDKDPWIFSDGELVLTSEVDVDHSIIRGARRRIPEAGYLTASDRPGYTQIALDEIIFDGCVLRGEQLRITLHAKELDLLTADDQYVRYRRSFAGDPRTWIGSYAPDDEAGDPETMADWKVWYRIEQL